MPRILAPRLLQRIAPILPRASAAAAALAVLALLPGLAAWSAQFDIKPGLWDIKVVRQIVDGHDASAQMAQVLAHAQQALANLPPEQRARMEAMLNNAGVSQGTNGSFRICVSAQMAHRDAPIIDRDGRCKPTVLNHTGNQVNFQFSCTTNGTTMQGKGDAVMSAEQITTRTDVTTSSAGGAHHIQNETRMQYVAADCGDLKPPAG